MNKLLYLYYLLLYHKCVSTYSGPHWHHSDLRSFNSTPSDRNIITLYVRPQHWVAHCLVLLHSFTPVFYCSWHVHLHIVYVKLMHSSTMLNLSLYRCTSSPSLQSLYWWFSWLS